MANISFQNVTVYELRRKGRPLAIGLSLDDLFSDCDLSHGTRLKCDVVQYVEQVGEIVGEVRDWNESDSPPQLKLHWRCPKCEAEQWGDFRADMLNPCLWYSECRCVGKWLISYNWPPATHC